MPDSVHDNVMYAQAVDHGQRRIVLHTVYWHIEPPEYTDIVFEGVIVHHFEAQTMGVEPYPGNVLFDVEEVPIDQVLEDYQPLLERFRNYGWPVFPWSDRADLARQLTAGGAKCFVIHGTCGLSGFVLAASMEFRARESRAQVTDGS